VTIATSRSHALSQHDYGAEYYLENQAIGKSDPGQGNDRDSSKEIRLVLMLKGVFQAMRIRHRSLSNIPTFASGEGISEYAPDYDKSIVCAGRQSGLPQA
jgi:hypothetical protein